MALHLKHLDRGGSGFHWVGNWYTEMHITLLRPHILRMDLDKQGGQPRERQEIPAGDEAEQRGRLTSLEFCGFFPQEMAVKDNRLSASGAQGSGSSGGSRAAP